MGPLQWRHNECGGVSNHRRLDCLLKHLFRRRSKKTSKLYLIGLCEGNPPMIDGFRSQSSSNAENVSAWWRNHVRWWFIRWATPSHYPKRGIFVSNGSTNKLHVNLNQNDINAINVNTFARNVMQGWVIASHTFLWDSITYPCLIFLLLARKSSYNILAVP